MDSFNLPTKKNQEGGMAAHGLRQAWEVEDRAYRQRRNVLVVGLLIFSLLVIALLTMAWPTIVLSLQGWWEQIKQWLQQLLITIQEWLIESERSVIEGDLFN